MGVRRLLLILGIVVGTVVGVGASVISESVTVTLRNDIRFKVNGETMLNGVNSIVYGDRVYVPIRDVTELVGVNINYTGKTIKIGTTKDITKVLVNKELDSGNSYLQGRDNETTWEEGNLDLEIIDIEFKQDIVEAKEPNFYRLDKAIVTVTIKDEDIIGRLIGHGESKQGIKELVITEIRDGEIQVCEVKAIKY